MSADVPPGGNNGRRAPLRGYAAWEPQAKTRLLIDQVDAILTEYEDHLPLTCRQIYYRLVGAYGHPKDEKFYERLCYALERGRRAELVPFSSIRDDGVTSMGRRWYDEPADFYDEVADLARSYHLDRQNGQHGYIELWCEASGMVPQLEKVAYDYSVSVRSCGGSNSLTAVRHLADRVVGRNVPTVLLHVGDFDPYGEDIYNAFIEDAQAFIKRDTMLPGIHYLIPERVALTSAQIAEHDLPVDKLKAPQSKAHATVQERWKAKQGDRTAQAEALPPDDLADIVRAAIEEYLDLDLIQDQVQAEDRQRTQLLRALPRGDDELPL
jgi:hypothetical protein